MVKPTLKESSIIKKSLPIAALAVAFAFTLSGCSLLSVDTELITSAGSEPAPVTPTETEPSDSDSSSDSSEIITGNVVTFIGQGLDKDANGEYPKFPVEISVAVANIEPITDSEYQDLLSVANDTTQATLSAFDLYKVFVNEQYISGDDPAYQASYTSYQPVNSDGVKLEDMSVIGFDWCDSSSFSRDFINGEVNSNCILALVPSGQPAPAGVQFSQYGTDTGDNPIVIFK